MVSGEDAQYRLQLALGFLGEAREDITIGRWRSCVDNSQLAAEKAATAVLALTGPVGRTHAVADPLRRAAAGVPPSVSPHVLRLAALTDQLNWDVHMASDYGDENNRRTPWEMFDEGAAQAALPVADEAVALAQEVVTAVLESEREEQ